MALCRCRCCLSEGDEMVDLGAILKAGEEQEEVSDVASDPTSSLTLYSIISWTFNCAILPDDDLPHTICLKCIDGIKNAYNFKRIMEHSNKILLDHLEDNKEKIDFDLSDDDPLADILKTKNQSDSTLDDEINNDDNIERDDFIIAIKSDSYSHEEDKVILKKKDHFSDYKKATNNCYYCTMCPERFINQFDMYAHYKTIHKSAKFGRPCDMCNQRFPDFKELIEHRKKHFHPYVCPVCWKGFYNESECKNHVNNCTPIVDEDKSVENENGRKMTMCHVCGKSYPTTYITVHMKIHNEGNLPCSFCGKKFKQPSALGSHIIWNHKKERKYKCEFCDKLFMTASSRGSHIRVTHIKERNIPCETCGKLFFSKSGLRKHGLTHTGEKNFGCHICDKSYQTRYGLNVHLKSHVLTDSMCIDNVSD